MIRSRIDTLPHQSAHHHWHGPDQRPSEPVVRGPVVRGRWGNWPTFGLYVLAGVLFISLLAHWTTTEEFPNRIPALFIGSVLGGLAATQAWFADQKWRSVLRLIVGLLAVQLIHPFLAARLGGPAEQWWCALILLLLTSQAVNAIMAQSTDDSRRTKGDYGLVDLLALGTLLAVIFELAKWAGQFPQVLLESFAWFGGAATMIGVSRFGLQQILEYWSNRGVGRTYPDGHRSAERSTISVVVETLGILSILVILNVGILVTLNYFRGSNPIHQGLMIVLVTAQIWQALDLWINHLARTPTPDAIPAQQPRLSVMT